MADMTRVTLRCDKCGNVETGDEGSSGPAGWVSVQGTVLLGGIGGPVYAPGVHICRDCAPALFGAMGLRYSGG